MMKRQLTRQFAGDLAPFLGTVGLDQLHDLPVLLIGPRPLRRARLLRPALGCAS